MKRAIKRYASLIKGLNYLVFHVTYKCNSNCLTCFNWRVLNKDHRELNLDEIKKISKNMDTLYYLTFSGGEPFLRSDLPDICKIFYKNNNTKVFCIPTNATQPEKIYKSTKKILENCPDSLIKICFSLDGLYAVHDTIRGLNGNFESFLKTYNLLKELKKNKNLFLTVITTFNKYNQNTIKELGDFVTNLDIDLLNINLIRGDARDRESLKYSIQKYISFKRYIDKKFKIKSKCPLKILLQIITLETRNMVVKTLFSKTRIFKCYAGRKLIVINPIGDVIICEPLNISLGNLREHNFDIKRILSLTKTKGIVKDIKAKKCNCTWECAIQNSLAYNIKTYIKCLLD